MKDSFKATYRTVLEGQLKIVQPTKEFLSMVVYKAKEKLSNQMATISSASSKEGK